LSCSVDPDRPNRTTSIKDLNLQGGEKGVRFQPCQDHGGPAPATTTEYVLSQYAIGGFKDGREDGWG